MSSIRPSRVRRADVAACMTCPLCRKLLFQQTTISLCLYTFCRDCIYKKFVDDECDTCPVYDINLGCDPADKLRPDHNLQDIRAKVFPIKRRMADAPEAVPPVSPPAKRKERSLSSLVVTTTSRTPTNAGVTGRRTKAGPRTSSAPKKGDSVEDSVEGENSPETTTKIIQNKKLVNGHKEDTRGVKNDGTTVCGLGRCKRQCSTSELTNTKKPPQLVVDVARPQQKDGPVSFSLVASADQVADGVAPLPQIPSGFLRVKTGEMPVSYVQKYVAKKLGLASEDEVGAADFPRRGLQPGLMLRELLDAWLAAAPGSRGVCTSAGSSAMDYGMVLTYSRKVKVEPRAGDS